MHVMHVLARKFSFELSVTTNLDLRMLCLRRQL